MGNVSLKVLEKSLNFLFKKGYKPCRVLSRGCMGQCMREFGQSICNNNNDMLFSCQATWRSELTRVHKFWVTHLHITFHSNNSITRWNVRKAFPIPPSPFHHHPPINVVPLLQVPVKPTLVWGRCEGTKLCFLFSPKCTLWKYLKNLFASDIVASEKILLLNLIIPWSKDTNSVSIAYICQCNIYMEVIPSQLVL